MRQNTQRIKKEEAIKHTPNNNNKPRVIVWQQIAAYRSITKLDAVLLYNSAGLIMFRE